MNSNLRLEKYPSEGKITLEEFFKFREESIYYWEFINGVAYRVDTSCTIHDTLILEFTRMLQTFFMGKIIASHGHVDVKLFKDRLDIVVPDACVLCDPNKDDGQIIRGAVDLVLEVWSPSNSKDLRDIKLQIYKDAKVKEIWEIYPGNKKILMWYLDDKSNEYERFEFDLFSEVESRLFPGLVLDYSLVEYRLDWDKSNYKLEL